MGRLSDEIKAEGGFQAFKERFNIPADVEIRFAKDLEHEIGLFPIVAITEGGLRFPVSLFLRQVFDRINLSPKCVTHNFYRIVNGVDEINRRYGFHLNVSDLLYCYNLQKVRRGENLWYLKSRPEKALVHMLPDNVRGLEDDWCVVTGRWMCREGDDDFPPITSEAMGPDDRERKSWAYDTYANVKHIEEVLKFLGGPDLYPFARSAPILFNFHPSYRSFISPPQGFEVKSVGETLHKWFSWTPDRKFEFYLTNHPAWRPAPSTATAVEEEVPFAPEALPISQAEVSVAEMPPRRDIKKAAEEKARQRRMDASRKDAEPRRDEEGKRAEVGRRVKEENIRRNEREKGVSIREPSDPSRRPPPRQEEDPRAKKKQKVGEPANLVDLDPPPPQAVPPTSSSAAPSIPSGSQSAPKARDEGGSGSHLRITYPINPFRDSATFVPQILVPSLEHPAGRPLTVDESAITHPEEFLKGVLPPRDINHVRKSRMDDLCTSLLKNMISSALHSTELVARAKSLHNKARSDDALIESFKSKGRELERRLEEAEARVRAAEEKAEASEKKANLATKHLASKDEELLEKIKDLAKSRAQLSESKKEEERLIKLFDQSRKEQNEVRTENMKLKLDLRTYMSAALEIEKALKATEAKATEDLEAQFDDFVGQMEDARNEYFLDGWEAAMSKLGVDSASETYRNVSFPVPDRLIPKFSFERDPRSPPIDLTGEKPPEEPKIDQPLEEQVAPSSSQVSTAPEEQVAPTPQVLAAPEEQVAPTSQVLTAPEEPPSKDAADLVTEVAKSIAEELNKDEVEGEDKK